MRTQPPIPNTLGALEMMCVMLANAPIAMAALTAGSVVSSNLSSMGVKDYWKEAAFGKRIRSVLLIY
jgi:hypothetical protein